ncbi:hypothetical protein AB6T38_06950 [Aliiglaciecola sp. SL4]|uniref:hypothetical protein n=1 Tax=Aliiglaciecola sp. SL4 TaxID=3239806 RepID=UPI00355C6B3B
MKIRTKQKTSEQLSLRIRPNEFYEIKEAATVKDISVSDEAKYRLKIASNYLSNKEMLRVTEARLKRAIFNMTCAVAGLSNEQIIEAEKRFVDITRNGVKNEK